MKNTENKNIVTINGEEFDINELVSEINNLDLNAHPEHFPKVREGLNMNAISFGTGNIRPTIYVEDFMEDFRKNGYKGVASAMLETIKNAPKFNDDLDVEEMNTWDFAKEHMLLCIAPKGQNKENFTVPYLDLELYFRVIVSKDDEITASYCVTKRHVEVWNVTENDLLEATSNNKYEIENFFDMTIITNKNKYHGASVMYAKEFLYEFAEEIDEDFYIIPSSKHEIIIAPMSSGNTVEELNAMVSSINASESIKEEDVLSNHIYVYHKDIEGKPYGEVRIPIETSN